MNSIAYASGVIREELAGEKRLELIRPVLYKLRPKLRIKETPGSRYGAQAGIVFLTYLCVVASADICLPDCMLCPFNLFYYDTHG